MKKYLLMLATAGLALSCNLYPGSDARTETLDVVLSYYDDQIDFQSMNTYALVEEVVELKVDGSTGNFTITPEIENAIINSVKANMAAYGWQLVDTADSPDLVIGMGATVTAHTNIYENFPGYGWGYPYFSYTVSTYPVGTIVLVGLDFKDLDPNTGVAPAAWFSIVQGPLTGGVSDQPARIDRDITQAYTQSGYLNLNP